MVGGIGVRTLAAGLLVWPSGVIADTWLIPQNLSTRDAVQLFSQSSPILQPLKSAEPALANASQQLAPCALLEEL